MLPHRLYEVIDTPTDIFLVMEHVSDGELFDFIVSRVGAILYYDILYYTML